MVPFRNPSGQIVFRVTGRKFDGSRIRENYREQAEAIGRKQELEIEALNMPVTVSLKKTRLTDLQLADAESAVQRLNGIAAIAFMRPVRRKMPRYKRT